MIWIAFALVFASVFLHALWHFLGKSVHPCLGFYLLFSCSLCLTDLPLLLFSGVMPWQFPVKALVCLLIGSCCGALCDIGLYYAYKYTNFSFAYPISRSLPVLFTPFVCGLLPFLGQKHLSVLAVSGMILVFAGCILMTRSASGFNFHLLKSRGTFGLLLASCAITCYTISDGIGIKSLKAAYPEANQILLCGAYGCVREIPVILIFSAIIFCIGRRKACLLPPLLKAAGPYMAGVSAAMAYVLVLFAMQFVENVSYVQAFRQMSLPVGMFMGLIFLKEKVEWTKWCAVVMLLCGLAMTVLQ